MEIREGEVIGIDLIGRIDALEVGERSLAFWGLGQVGVAIKGPTGVLYVDPYLTDSDGEGGSLPRTFPPPLAPAEVTNASAVVLTHVHIDHTDPHTVLPLSEASPDARFVAPFTSNDTLVEAGLDEKRILVPEIGEPVAIAGPGSRPSLRPTRSWSATPSAATLIWATSSSGTMLLSTTLATLWSTTA
jgi:L-ascorbate 6-phosphate lactonase